MSKIGSINDILICTCIQFEHLYLWFECIWHGLTRLTSKFGFSCQEFVICNLVHCLLLRRRGMAFMDSYGCCYNRLFTVLKRSCVRRCPWIVVKSCSRFMLKCLLLGQTLVDSTTSSEKFGWKYSSFSLFISLLHSA